MRSKLFVPGSRPELFPKALAGQADALSFDLEDSVVEERKAEARHTLEAYLRSAELAASTKIVIVRVNDLHSPHFKDDVAAVACARLDYLNVPKVESAEDIRAVVAALAAVEAKHGLTRPISIIANIESPRGLRCAAEIGAADPRVAGLQLGFADLLGPLGIDRVNAAAVQQLQLMLRLAAGEAGVWAYDAAFAAVDDPGGYRVEAVAAKHMGYLGKTCIHPSQVALANDVFRPTDEEITHAQRVVAAAAEAEKTGVGAFTVDGRMIDRPFIDRAKALVAVARQLAGSAKTTPVALKQRDYDPSATGPLANIRVLDLSRLFAGNVLTQILGDFGAEVIKVEPPEGDTLRDWQTNGVSTHWKIYSRNKKSLALDLRKPEAIDLLRRLVPSATLFIESFRPGTLEKMGLGPDCLLALNPKLVIARISGWGQDGPYCKRPGFGTVIEGMSGFASFNGFADREPVLPPMYLADAVGGLYGASAVMIALREVERNGGQGQVIDLPLLDPLFAVLSPQAANYRLTGKGKPRAGSRSTNSAPRNTYRCKDGRYVALSGSTQKMAERLFRVIGRPELVNDPRFRTNADRLKHADELDAIIGPFIAERTQAENVAFFEQTAVTVGPIYDIAQIMEDPHFVEREILADYPDPETGKLPMHHVVPRLLGTPGAIRTPAPRLGEHNRSVLAELGVNDAAYAGLVAAGVVIKPAEKK